MKRGNLRRLVLAVLALGAVQARAEAPPVATAPSGTPAVAVSFGVLANLTYQLDCVAGVIANCGTADFEALWKRRFLRTGADRQAVAQWARSRKRYAESLPAQISDTTAPPIYGTVGGLSIEERMRTAGFRARTRREYASSLVPLVAPADRQRLLAVIDRFLTPFERWMHSEATKRGGEFVRATQSWLTGAGHSTVQGLITLYDARLSSRDTVVFALLYRPGLAEAPSFGQAYDRFALVEFLAGEQPVDRLPVAVHELAHVLSQRTHPETRTRVQRAFLALGEPGLAAYALLEEGMAVAAGTVPVERALRSDSAFAQLMRSPGSLYNVPEVDRAGRALVPLAQEWLSQRKRIDDSAFPERVLVTLRAAFDSASDVRGLTAPRNLLHMRTAFVDEAFGNDAARLRQIIAGFSAHFSITAQDRCDSSDLLTGYRSYPNLPALFVVRTACVPALVRAGVIPAAADTTSGTASFTTVYPQTRTAPVWVIVADSASDAARLLERMGTVPAHSTNTGTPLR